MLRRFVNLVAKNSTTGAHSLHRLEVSKHLFHQSRSDARVAPLLAGAEGTSCGDAQPMLGSLQELPAPCVKILPSLSEDYVVKKLPLWASLSPRRSEDRFLCINLKGDAMLCSADKPSVDPMPHLRDEVGVRPISLSVARRPQDAQEEEEDLYVIIHKSSSFRVLRKDAAAAGGWRWESLPPLPFVDDRRYDPVLFMYSNSHAVVDGGRTICFSCPTPGIGTYCFDTVECEWRHAGDWLLPFQGGAEHVPDLDLWLGFSPCAPHYLCATSSLDVTMSMEHPPKLQYVWQDIATPESWSAIRTQVVSLGSGRFCVAKAFVISNESTGGESESGDEECLQFEEERTVLTGIEVGRDDNGEDFKVWKHKSVQFSSPVVGVL